jgi:anti-anti-sigma factor
MQTSPLVDVIESPAQLILTILTSISLIETEQLRRELRGHLAREPRPRVVFRMERVHHLDSSGLGLFVSLQNEFQSSRFVFQGLTANVRMVFEFSQLLTYFQIEPSQAVSQEPPEKTVPLAQEPRGPREFLAIEGKYILTDEGEKYCTQRQIPTRELRLYRGTTVAGFNWTSIDTGLLERFVTHGLLAGMELERAEFLDKREQILRLTEVVFDGITMKRFRPTLKLRLMEDAAYRELAAQNVPPEQLRAAVKANASVIAGLRSEIESLAQSRSPSATRKRTSRLLALVDDSVWFLLTRGTATAAQRALRQRVLDALADYSGRLELSESIALNLMEFLQQAERAHFLNLAERDPLTRKSRQAVPELLADAKFRERLIAKARLQNEYLVINMNFDGNPHNSRAGLAAEISVRNKGTANNSLRIESLSESSKTAPQKSVEELMDEEGAALGDLSLLNLNALRELCRAQGIAITTSLTRDERLDETVASMRLVL